jgi:hypothetical protein
LRGWIKRPPLTGKEIFQQKRVMNASSADGKSETKETQWPTVPKIPGDEFQQSFAVAQLALKLWQGSKTSNVKSIEKADPKDFLADAWELIESAREHVLRPQTGVEYLAATDGSTEALVHVLERLYPASLVPFQQLCDSTRNQGDTEMIGRISWKVYRSERGFDELFRDYWQNIGEKLKRGDPEISTFETLDTQGKLRRENFYPESKRKKIAALWKGKPEKMAIRWKKRGKRLINLWKKHGVPTADFLAFANFRRQRDNRVANLKKSKLRTLGGNKAKPRARG